MTTRSVEDQLVAICTGKDCRKRREHRELCDALRAAGPVVDMSCSGICAGPVVVADVADDEPLVLARVRKRKQRRDVVAVIADGDAPTERLGKLQVTGSKRKKALRKARRAMRRSS